jgi:hypothetical protein
MSGRWGDRPLGRGGWRVLQPEASPVLPPVPLRLEAAKRHTGANLLTPEAATNSRSQLPFCPHPSPPSIDRRVHSSQYFPATLSALYLVPTYLRQPFAASLTLIKLPDKWRVLYLETPARELDANGRPINKRRHVRIGVTFSASVRHPAQTEEIVECENLAKGGVCFHSLEQYPLDSLIELAAPFSPGGDGSSGLCQDQVNRSALRRQGFPLRRRVR